jgi:uncharacterized protein (TIGR03000 family)
MNRHVPLGLRHLTALVVAVVGVGTVQAQTVNPIGSQYPYWGTTPQRDSGPQVTVPGASAIISSAAHSRPLLPNPAIGIGGGYLPPSLTAADIRRADSKAHIWLRVPDNAEVWVNGVKTKQAGETRYFYSPPLAEGKKYGYDMRISWKKDGESVEKTERIVVQAGARVQRDFMRSDKTEPRP